LQVGPDYAEGSRRRDAEGVHGLTRQVFADARAQDGPAVAEPGEHRFPGPLQVQVPALAGRVLDFAEQNRPPVAELRDVGPELVARVLHRDRVAPGQLLVAGEVLDEVRGHRLGRVEVNEASRIRVEGDQVRVGNRCRRNALVERGREPGVGVVERQVGEGAHDELYGRRYNSSTPTSLVHFA